MGGPIGHSALRAGPLDGVNFEGVVLHVEEALKKAGNIKPRFVPKGRPPAVQKKAELIKSRLILTETKRPEELKGVAVGEEVFYYEGRRDYAIR